MPRVRLKIGRLFQIRPRLAVHLIRLMAAGNDIDTIVSSYMQLPASPEGPAERSRINGRRVYFFRLAYGHLYEAIQVLRDLARDCPDILERVPSEVAVKYREILAALEELEKALKTLRNRAIFHYDYAEMEEVLRQWGADAEGEILIGEERGGIRYSIADEALTTAILKAFGLPSPDTEDGKRSVGDFLDRLLPLLFDLMDFVLGLLQAAAELYPELIEVAGN